MKKINFTKVKKFLDGKGFIFALLLSIAAVGTATYIAYNGAINGLGDINGNEGEQTIAVGNEQDGIAKETEATTTEGETEAANNFLAPSAPRIMPVEGEIINDYSNGELVKSETLGVWQTHDGIDIAAEVGTEVKAATEGTVSDVFEDPLWGICVSIDHGDGFVGYYFGLDKSVGISAGQVIKSGDIIGTVGTTADIECALAPHLHFAIRENGAFINPCDFING